MYSIECGDVEPYRCSWLVWRRFAVTDTRPLVD